MIRVFLSDGRYATHFNVDTLTAVADTLRLPIIGPHAKVVAVTFNEDPMETAARLGLR